MRQSEDEMMAAMLGIPNVHVLSLEESESRLRVVVETKAETALCA